MLELQRGKRSKFSKIGLGHGSLHLPSAKKQLDVFSPFVSHWSVFVFLFPSCASGP